MVLNFSGAQMETLCCAALCLATSGSAGFGLVGSSRAGSGGFGEVLLRRDGRGGSTRPEATGFSFSSQSSKRAAGGVAGGRRGMGGALILMFCFSCPSSCRVTPEAGWGGHTGAPWAQGRYFGNIGAVPGWCGVTRGDAKVAPYSCVAVPPVLGLDLLG